LGLGRYITTTLIRETVQIEEDFGQNKGAQSSIPGPHSLDKEKGKRRCLGGHVVLQRGEEKRGTRKPELV